MRTPLRHFVLVGLALFLIRGLWESSSTPDRMTIELRRSEIDESISEFEARLGRGATDDEKRAVEEQIIEKALWLAQAKILGLHRSDPVVRQRLIQNMRFLETEADQASEALFERALELEMDSSDSIVARRLIDRVQALIRAGVRSQTPSDTDLRSHYDENAQRWTEPALLDFSHVYFSRDKRGAVAVDAADDLFQFLNEEESFLESAIQRGDPFLSGHHLRSASPAQIAARLGPNFLAKTRNASTLKWIGPIESAFGFHLVWIHRRKDAFVPPFEALRARVRERWFDEETLRTLRIELARHRTNVELQILDDVGSPSPARGS